MGQEWTKGLEAKLWNGDIMGVIKGIEGVKLKGKGVRRLIRNAVEYYSNNAERMDYQRYRAEGYLIGSGVIEGACKSVAGQRLKVSGARWDKENAERILHIRIYRASGWWSDFWNERRKAA